jgi:anti-anti-sigma factor
MRETDDIRIERPGEGTAVVVLTGEHDLSVRAEVEDILESVIGENRIVVADLSEAEFVDSTIISLLVQAKRDAAEQGCSFRLQLGTEAIVRRIFDVTGVLDLLEVAETREEASRETSTGMRAVADRT